MGVYPGWQSDLLTAARMPNTQTNVAFLDDWHNSAASNCALNPVDLTAPNGNSHHCKQLGKTQRYFQSYASSHATRAAFAAQLSGGHYPNLRAAIRSGDPYTYGNAAGVVGDIVKWGSYAFAGVYNAESQAGGPPQTINAPQALRGWSDMQRSINRHMPHALAETEKMRAHAWRQLARLNRMHM